MYGDEECQNMLLKTKTIFFLKPKNFWRQIGDIHEKLRGSPGEMLETDLL